MPEQKITENPAPAQGESLPPILADEVARLERKIVQVRGMAPSVALADELERRFPDQYYTRSVDAIFGEFNIFFKFKTMSQAATLFRLLAAEKGLHLKGKPSISEDGGTYYWRVPGICIIGMFSSTEADACKLVQVGTKTVPVYELRCGAVEPGIPGSSKPAVTPVAAEVEGVPF